MIFSELLQDVTKLGPERAGFPIMLATRTVDGALLEPGKMQTSEVGELFVDDHGQDVDLVPTAFLQPSPGVLTAADVVALSKRSPLIGDFRLSGVDGKVMLPDGRVATSTLPIIASLILDDSLLLLMYPREQWPDSLFKA